MLAACIMPCGSDVVLQSELTWTPDVVAFSMQSGLQSRVLQVGHQACAAGCVTKDLAGCSRVAAAEVSVIHTSGAFISAHAATALTFKKVCRLV